MEEVYIKLKHLKKRTGKVYVLRSRTVPAAAVSVQMSTASGEVCKNSLSVKNHAQQRVGWRGPVAAGWLSLDKVTGL